MDDQTEKLCRFFLDLLGERSLGLGSRKTRAYRARLRVLIPDGEDTRLQRIADENAVEPRMPQLSDAFHNGDGSVS